MLTTSARDLRDLLAAAAAKAGVEDPLRVSVRRRAPLTSQGEKLGALDVLLRVSCRGDGQGPGVLVFDWPRAANGHSVVRLLEGWSDRSSAVGPLRVERSEGTMSNNGSPAVPSWHLKVHFDAAQIPDDLSELLNLACRMGIKEPVGEAVGKLQAVEAPVSRNGKAPVSRNGNGVAPADRRRAPRSPAEQESIDQIVNHARYDRDRHPQVNPNDEVVNSSGEVFRLICRRASGALQRQWVRIGHA